MGIVNEMTIADTTDPLPIEQDEIEEGNIKVDEKSIQSSVHGISESNSKSKIPECKKPKKLSKGKRNLLAIEEKQKKKGVCYLSRVPPHMKPLKLRHLLEQFGEILRIYLAPEDAATVLRRKRSGGNRGKNFTEGWVEFGSKKTAKRVAEMLNGEPMEQRKRSAYHYDLWTIKYLHKFKWDNLTEEIAYRNAVREQKLSAEISKATKERDFYLSKVDQSRAINAMAERKRKREEGGNGNTDDQKKTNEKKERKVMMRHFHQRESLKEGSNSSGSSQLQASILAKVLGSS